MKMTVIINVSVVSDNEITLWHGMAWPNNQSEKPRPHPSMCGWNW